ncbi:MAG: glycine--tRNA ligase, partial [Thermoplasmata archaeon]
MAEQSAKDAKRSRQDELVALAKRRGFFWPSYEIYGGLAGFYDYGPLGFLMKDNLVSLWKKYFVIKEGFLGIDSPIIGPEEVFRASGHLATFADLIVECSSKECNYAARVDHLAKEIVALNEEEGWQNEEVRKFKEILIGIAEERHKDPVFIGDIFSKVGVKCTLCGAELAIPKPFNLMFSTKVGPGKGKQGYLRPETAQSMFVNFLLLYRVNREKLPVGIVQIGRSFRNEIAPRQGMIRLREFNQAEAEIFFDPLSKDHPAFDSIANDRALFITGEGTVLKGATFGELVGNGTINSKALAYYMAITRRFLLDAGLSPQKIRFRQHKKSEMAHYASDCWDVEACLWAAAADEKGKADEGSLMNEQWLEIVGIAD